MEGMTIEGPFGPMTMRAETTSSSSRFSSARS
jgi:hypothetical protein